MLDLPLTIRCKKRPDTSFQIRKTQIPDPHPPWMKFLPDRLPYPNIVIEVAVNNESPAKLMLYAHRYFSGMSSIRVWIGVKIWLKEKKFWVGWAELSPAGFDATMHSNMSWPPDNSSWETPVDIVYPIPIALVYGPGINIPENAPPTLDINAEEIRLQIMETMT